MEPDDHKQDQSLQNFLEKKWESSDDCADLVSFATLKIANLQQNNNVY